MNDGNFYRCTRGNATAGFTARDGRVTSAAPILRCLGRPEDDVLRRLLREGWKIDLLEKGGTP